MILGCGSPDPHSESTMYGVICYDAMHETCHTIDLVNDKHLGGKKDHNPTMSNEKDMMMYHSLDLKDLLKNFKLRTWRPLNLDYLRFVLPKPNKNN